MPHPRVPAVVLVAEMPAPDPPQTHTFCAMDLACNLAAGGVFNGTFTSGTTGNGWIENPAIINDFCWVDGVKFTTEDACATFYGASQGRIQVPPNYAGATESVFANNLVNEDNTATQHLIGNGGITFPSFILWTSNEGVGVNNMAVAGSEVFATAGGTTAITGTSVTMSNGSTAVTGVGTSFNTQLVAGEAIKLNADANSAWMNIASIGGATSLTLTNNYTGTGGTGPAAFENGGANGFVVSQFNGAEVSGCCRPAWSLNSVTQVDSGQEGNVAYNQEKDYNNNSGRDASLTNNLIDQMVGDDIVSGGSNKPNGAVQCRASNSPTNSWQQCFSAANYHTFGLNIGNGDSGSVAVQIIPPDNTSASEINGRNAANGATVWTIQNSGNATFPVETSQILQLNGGSNQLQATETTAPSGAGSTDVCYGDSTAHGFKCNYNNATNFGLLPLFGGSYTFATGNLTTTFNSAMTTDAQDAITLGETSAATNGTLTNGLANQTEVAISTATNSTAAPLEVTQGSITNTVATPLAQFESTWNNSGLTGQGIVENITNTSSATGSLLMNLKASNVTQFSVSPTITNVVGFLTETANRVAMTADWTCGTGGTVSSCVAATIVGSTGTPMTISLPVQALSWDFDCDGVVSSATGTPANNWNLITATNGATNVTSGYMMGTAAGVGGFGATTDTASTTTTFSIGGTWVLGAAGTKFPFHIHARVEGASASAGGTVISLQVVDPTVADLLTIYRGMECWAH